MLFILPYICLLAVHVCVCVCGQESRIENPKCERVKSGKAAANGHANKNL